MASSTIRKAIGAVKDQTSIGLAKVSCKIAPELVIAIVKATGHDDEPASEKHIREIINLASCSRGYASACVFTISGRLSKTRDWVVALKTLILVHRLITDGVPAFNDELLFASRRGSRVLNLSYFRDEVHHSSWDHSAFVRTYALYLEKRLDYVRSLNLNFSLPEYEERKPAIPLREMPEKVLDRMDQLQQLFDRFLACRPIGLAKNNRMIFNALYPIVRESFQLYADICEILGVLLNGYFDMEYADCLKSFEAYSTAAKQIDELIAFYGWCKDTGVARSSEYPDVQRITDKLLETLGEFKRERATRLTNSSLTRVEPAATVQEEELVPDMDSIKALPAFSDHEKQQVPKEPKPEHKLQILPQPQGALVDLREDDGTADAQGNKLASALFSSGSAVTGNWTWQEEMKQTLPAAEEMTADWELALVETASKAAKQNAALGEGFDPLLLNSMYNHGEAVRRRGSAPASLRTASSVVLPAPDGPVQNIGRDPFVASLGIPPPSYVQMSDIRKKQLLLMREQQLWHHYYTQNGMQGKASLAKLNNAYDYPNPVIQSGVPTPASYYHPNILRYNLFHQGLVTKK